MYLQQRSKTDRALEYGLKIVNKSQNEANVRRSIERSKTNRTLIEIDETYSIQSGENRGEIGEKDRTRLSQDYEKRKEREGDEVTFKETEDDAEGRKGTKRNGKQQRVLRITQAQ